MNKLAIVVRDVPLERRRMAAKRVTGYYRQCRKAHADRLC